MDPSRLSIEAPAGARSPRTGSEPPASTSVYGSLTSKAALILGACASGASQSEHHDVCVCIAVLLLLVLCELSAHDTSVVPCTKLLKLADGLQLMGCCVLQLLFV